MAVAAVSVLASTGSVGARVTVSAVPSSARDSIRPFIKSLLGRLRLQLSEHEIQDANESGIERSPSFVADKAAYVRVRDGLLVCAARGHGVEHVGHAGQAADRMLRPAGGNGRIAAHVEADVMLEGDDHRQTVRAWQAAQEIRAEDGVTSHDLPFLFVERARRP